jgi:nucleotide-binding universal stress UspA family protein
VIRASDVAGTIEGQARRHRADVIVMATRGRTGLSRLVLGSVAADVVRKSDLPVILLREGGEPTEAAPGGGS